MSIAELIILNLPVSTRQELVDKVGFDYYHMVGNHKYPKRHSIMDALRRLKLADKVEEWCEGTITLAGHVPTRND